MIKNINVIQIIDTLETGGAEMMAVNIANALLTKVTSSHLCVTRKSGLLAHKIHPKVAVINLNKSKTLDVKAFYTLYKYIKQNKINVIHAHSSSFFIAVIIKIFKPSLRIIWHDHYGLAEQVNLRKKQPLVLFSYFFNGVICVNELLKNWGVQNLKIKNIQYFPNFGTLDFSLQNTQLAGENTFKIVCSAAFRQQKDHLNLLHAFYEFSKIHPKTSLHLVGNYIDSDDYYLSILNFIYTYHLQDKVFIYGSCIDMAHILSQANIGVLSSFSEGLPVSLLEYGLVGLPVLVTDVGECKNVVQDFGWLVPSKNYKAFAAALEEIYQSEELRNHKANAFKNHILANYSQENFIHSLLNIYHNVS